MHKDLSQRIMQEIAKQPTVLAPKASVIAKRPVLWSAAASVAGLFL